MCQRKIIGKGVFKIVPVLNGCACPTIKEIRDIDTTPRKKYSLPNYCFDMFTDIIGNEQGDRMFFRHCVCRYPAGVCGRLPLFEADDEDENEDEDNDNEGGVLSQF